MEIKFFRLLPIVKRKIDAQKHLPKKKKPDISPYNPKPSSNKDNTALKLTS
jgi:hypothetical protein